MSIFTPFRMGTITIPNRFVSSACEDNLATEILKSIPMSKRPKVEEFLRRLQEGVREKRKPLPAPVVTGV